MIVYSTELATRAAADREVPPQIQRNATTKTFIPNVTSVVTISPRSRRTMTSSFEKDTTYRNCTADVKYNVGDSGTSLSTLRMP